MANGRRKAKRLLRMAEQNLGAKILLALAMLAIGSWLVTAIHGEEKREVRLIPATRPDEKSYSQLWMATEEVLRPWLETTKDISIKRELAVAIIPEKSPSTFLVDISFPADRSSVQVTVIAKNQNDAHKAVETIKQTLREIFPPK